MKLTPILYWVLYLMSHLTLQILSMHLWSQLLRVEPVLSSRPTWKIKQFPTSPQHFSVGVGILSPFTYNEMQRN